MLSTIYFLSFLLSLLFTRTVGLFCYTCSVPANQNTRCNEIEPMKCGSIQTKCGSRKSSSQLTKGCMEKCPIVRGDSIVDAVCSECGEDLCNEPDIGYKQPKNIQPQELHVSNFVFTLFLQPSTFWNARLHCIQRSEVLATVKRRELQKYLEKQLSTIVRTEVDNDVINGLWVGMTSLNDTAWLWSDDGSSISLQDNLECNQENIKYQNWLRNHPLPLPSTRKQTGGVLFDPMGKWMSASPGEKMRGFICQSLKYKKDLNKKDFIQSVVVNSNVYTFHSEQANHSKAVKICQRTSGHLADLRNKSTFNDVTRQLSYAMKSNKFWSNHLCEKDPPNAKSPTTYARLACSTSMPFICEKPFKNEDCSSNPCMDDLTCTSQIINSSGTLLSFPMTSYRTFTVSKETCPSGRPMGSVFCDLIDGSFQYDLSTLAASSCSQTIDNVLNKSSTQAQLSASTRDLRLLTSEPSVMTQNDITKAIDVLKSTENISGQDSGVVVTPQVATDVITTISSLQTAIARLPEEKVYDTNELSSLVETFLKRVTLDRSNPSYRLTTGQLKVKALKLDTSDEIINPDDITFSSSSEKKKESFIVIEQNALRKAIQSSKMRNNSLRAVFIAHNNGELFPSEKGFVRQVVTATVSNEREEEISLPVVFGFKRSNQTIVNECLLEECSFYDDTNRTWSTNGCHLLPSNRNRHNDTVYCTCSHTTSFAVVVSYDNAQENVALNIASQIGLIICVFCLLLTVIIFVKVSELRRISSSGIHTNLCVCLLLAYTLFLLGIEQTYNRSLCVAIAASIHYLLLATWGWMAVESITMFRMFVYAMEGCRVLSCRQMAVVIYVSSAVVVLLTIAGVAINWEINGAEQSYDDCPPTDVWSGYISNDFCWITGLSFYAGFIAIIGIILLSNIIMGFAVIRAITWGRTKIQSSIEEPASVQVVRAISVAVLMGMAWVFAIPVIVSRDENVKLTFAWIFAICISLQGLFMFYFFCVRRPTVRKVWLDPVINVLCCKKWNPCSEKDPGQDTNGFRSNGHGSTTSRQAWKSFSKPANTERSLSTELTSK